MKKIKEHPNYFVTKAGKVWSNKKNKWLKPYQRNSNSKHLAVDLNGKPNYIHRLVLETFVGKCPQNMETRHLDGNPLNNNLSNLKWGTRSENQKDAVNHGTHRFADNSGENNGMSKLTEQKIKSIRQFYKFGKYNQPQLAKIFNVSNGCICNIINRNGWKNV